MGTNQPRERIDTLLEEIRVSAHDLEEYDQRDGVSRVDASKLSRLIERQVQAMEILLERIRLAQALHHLDR